MRESGRVSGRVSGQASVRESGQVEVRVSAPASVLGSVPGSARAPDPGLGLPQPARVLPMESRKLMPEACCRSRWKCRPLRHRHTLQETAR